MGQETTELGKRLGRIKRKLVVMGWYLVVIEVALATMAVSLVAIALHT